MGKELARGAASAIRTAFYCALALAAAWIISKIAPDGLTLWSVGLFAILWIGGSLDRLSRAIEQIGERQP